MKTRFSRMAALLLLSSLIPAPAAFGANTPFGEPPPRSAATSAKRAQCQSAYNYRMGLVEKHYAPAMQKLKQKIETLHSQVIFLMRKPTISVAEQGLMNIKKSQMAEASKEFDRLRRERIARENTIKSDLAECLRRAGP